MAMSPTTTWPWGLGSGFAPLRGFLEDVFLVGAAFTVFYG